jgi:uncharacterized protein YndB with AHSA1/START domain
MNTPSTAASDDRAANPAPTADNELEVSHVVHAPAALAFNAWIEPQQLAQWWGPEGFETTVHEMSVEPEGTTRLVMRGPDGVEYPNKLVYTAITAAHTLAYTQSDDSDPDNDAADFDVTVQFDDEGLEQTRITMRLRFRSAAERDRVVARYDAAGGATQTLQRLDRFLRDFLPGGPVPGDKGATVAPGVAARG